MRRAKMEKTERERAKIGKTVKRDETPRALPKAKERGRERRERQGWEREEGREGQRKTTRRLGGILSVAVEGKVSFFKIGFVISVKRGSTLLIFVGHVISEPHVTLGR